MKSTENEMNINFSIKVDATDFPKREISGRIVTWDEIGATSAGETKFEKGSISFGDSTKLLLEHQRQSPIGFLKSYAVTEQGIDATFSVLPTNAGNDSLIEASSGARDGFSVGVSAKDFKHVDGVLVIKASKLQEVSLVTDPAIASAKVSVAASEPELPATEEIAEENPTTTEGDEVDTTPVQAPEAAAEVVDASAPITANKPVAYAVPRNPIKSKGDYLWHSIQATRGNEDSKLYINATNNTTGDNPGLIPTRQLTEVINGLADNVRASIDSISTGALPDAGMTFQIPKITTLPSVAETAEDGATPNVNMESDYVDVDVKKFSGSQIMSVELQDRSQPLFVTELLRNLEAQYARATNEYNSGVILTGSTSGSPTYAAPVSAVNVLKWIADGAVSIYSATNRFADAVVMSPANWGNVMSMSVDGRPIYNALIPSNAAGNAQPRSLRGSINGLDLWVDTALSGTGDGSMYVINRDAYTWYESPRLRLTSNLIDNGQIQIMLYGYGATATKIAAGAYNFQAT